MAAALITMGQMFLRNSTRPQRETWAFSSTCARLHDDQSWLQVKRVVSLEPAL